MKKNIFTNLLTAFLALQVTDGIAATTVVQCDTSTPVKMVNTCAPEVTLNVAATGQVFNAISNVPVELSIVGSLFDTSTLPIIKIVKSGATSHLSFYGLLKQSVFGGNSKRVLVNITAWPNSSSVGISQLLSGKITITQLMETSLNEITSLTKAAKSTAISGYPNNAFYGFSPSTKYIANSCVQDASSTQQAPTLNCPVTSISYKPNLVLSHVEPNEYQALNVPVTGILGKLSLVKSVPTFLAGFGVAVNDSFYRALQGQNVRDGVLPLSCSIGDKSGVCQPSIKQAQLASLMSKEGSVKSASHLIPGEETILTLNQAHITHSAKAVQNLLLLNNPCGRASNSTLTPVSSADNSSKLQVKETYLTNDEVGLAISTGTGYQLGLQPLSSNALFIKLDASSPNFDINGQVTYQNRTQTANGLNPLATMTYSVRLVKEDAGVKAAADAFWLALQSSAWSDIKGLAYFDGASDSSTTPKQSNVRRLQNTNCSPLIHYKNTAVIYPVVRNPNNISNPDSILASLSVLVSGLPNGESLTLLNNGSDPVTVFANGNITFNNGLSINNPLFNVTVSSQPSGYICTVQNGAGNILSIISNFPNISPVLVVCTAPLNVSGTLSGLDAGQTITLSNNDNDSITLSANGTFNFTKPIPAGTTYSISIQQEPDYKLCKVSQGSGTAASNVTNIIVECLTPVVSQFSEIYIYYAAGTAVDLSGNVYLVYPDAYRSRGGIDKITKFTPAGVESIVAGGGQSGSSDGNGEAASFNYPMDVAVSASGILYVADTDNNLIRKITPAGDVTTVAGSLQNGFLNGADKSAKFSYPRAVALDSLGNVYVSDSGNFRIRKIMPDGVVSTFAGSGQNGYADGNGEAASFSYLDDIAVDASDNMYVSDRGNNKIRKITPAGVVSTFASVEKPTGIAVDKLGNLYILSSEGGRVILKITPQGKQNVLAGRFQYNCYSWLWGNICPRDVIGEGRDAMFKDPKGIAVDESGNLYVANEGSRIRKITFVKSAP